DPDAEPPIVTCQYMVYDAWSRELSFANAGHTPPLLLVDGTCTELNISEVGQPLGVHADGRPADLVYKEETHTLPPGAALLLYTDGLIDRRPVRDAEGRPLDDSATLAVLCEKLAKVQDAPIEQLADAATSAVPGDIDDDMAILVIRSSPVDLDVEERTFPAQPIMVGEARRMAAEAFAEWNVPEESAELACLLVSEVVTNVVLHAASASVSRRNLLMEGPPLSFEDSWDIPLEEEIVTEKQFTLRPRRGSESVWVEVFDQDLRLPRIRSAGENDEGGRGLYLVDQLASRWGSRPTNEGKAVWFEVPAWRRDRTGH